MDISQQAAQKLFSRVYLVYIWAKWHALNWRGEFAKGHTTLSETLEASPGASRQVAPLIGAESEPITALLSDTRLYSYIHAHKILKALFPEKPAYRPSGKTTPGSVLAMLFSTALAILLIELWRGQHTAALPDIVAPAVELIQSVGKFILWSLPLILLRWIQWVRIRFHNRNTYAELFALILPILHLLQVTGTSVLSKPDPDFAALVFLASSWVGSLLALHHAIQDRPTHYCEASGVFLTDLTVILIDVHWLPNAVLNVQEGNYHLLNHFPEPQTAGLMAYIAMNTHPEAATGYVEVGAGTRYRSAGYERSDTWTVLERRRPTSELMPLTWKTRNVGPADEISQRRFEDAVAEHPIDTPTPSPFARLLWDVWYHRELAKAESDRLEAVGRVILAHDQRTLPHNHLRVLSSMVQHGAWLLQSPQHAETVRDLIAPYFSAPDPVDTHCHTGRFYLDLMRHYLAISLWRIGDYPTSRHHLSTLQGSPYCIHQPDKRMMVCNMLGWIAIFTHTPAQEHFSEPPPPAEEPGPIQTIYVLGGQLCENITSDTIDAAIAQLDDLSTSSEPQLRRTGQLFQARLRKLASELSSPG